MSITFDIDQNGLGLATIDMRMDYLRPGRGHEFVATAQVLRMGRKLVFGEMEVLDAKGQLAAHATTTYTLL